MLGLKDYSTGGYDFNSRMAAALEAAGHSVCVLHYNTIPERIRGSRFRGSLHVLNSVLRNRPELVIVSKSYSFMAPLRLMLPFLSVPVLYMVHHLEWHDRKEGASLPRRNVVRWLLGSGDRVWVNSASTAADVASLGIPTDRTVVIPPGFARFAVAPRERGEEQVRILTVGTLCPRKDQLTLVRACGELPDLDFQLHIAGDESADPEYSNEVRSLVEETGIAGRTVFHGHLSMDGLHRIYGESHILANLSRWEGYGIAVAEAMWAGLPVVAADAGAVPELVEDGIQGFLVPPGDSDHCAGRLRELITDEALRSAMSRRARLRAEGLFTWQDTGREFVKLVESTVHSGK